MVNFTDILKGKFLEEFSAISVNEMLVAIALSFALSLFIVFIYKITYAGVSFSHSFAGCLIMISMVTTVVILVITSNVVLSLGMVGALSIVRFRTAIKDPMDLMFLFWAIAIGIICGVGMAEIAIILSILMTVGILVLNGLPVAKAPMILVVNASELDAEEAIVAVVKQYAGSSTVKSRNMTKSSLDLIIELRTAEGSKLVREVLDIPCVCSASLMNHDGEVTF